MTRDGLPPRFTPWLPPKVPVIARAENRARFRISPRLRGYDARWDRLSQRFRRACPWCYFCMQGVAEERWELTAVADHVLPAHDFPKIRYTWTNLIPLCSAHHDGLKQRMENAARKVGRLQVLETWVHFPAARPIEFQPAVIFEVSEEWRRRIGPQPLIAQTGL